MLARFKTSKDAFNFIFNQKNSLNDSNKQDYFAAFAFLDKDPTYWDLLQLNEDDERLLENRNALEAYCHYILETFSEEHHRYRMVLELIGKRLAEHIVRGEITQIPSPGWWIPTIDLIARIKMKLEKKEDPGVVVLSNGKVAKISDLKFTILDDKKVAFRSASELATLCAITNCTTPITLVAFRPNIIALHEAQKRIITSIQLLPEDTKKEVALDHEEYLSRIVDLVMSESKQKIEEESKKLIELRLKLETDVSQIYDLLENDKMIPKSMDDSVVRAVLSYRGQIKKNGEDSLYRKAIVDLTVDTLYKQAAEKEMSSIINKTIENLIQRKKIFTLQTSDTPYLFMVAGGQASGKSKSILEFKILADTERKGWANVYKGGGDCMRSQFLKYAGITDMNPELFAQLTQSQAGYVSHTLVAGAIKEMAKERKAPDMLIEQVYVGQDKLDLVRDYGKAFVTIVSTEVLGPNGTVSRAFERGKTIGRFENAKNILSYHKGSTVQLPDRILENLGRNVYMKIVDNNGDFSEPPALVAEIDCKKGNIIIHDKEKLEKFIKKTALNPEARCPEEAYDNELLKTATIEHYFDKLKDSYQLEYKKTNKDGLKRSL